MGCKECHVNIMFRRRSPWDKVLRDSYAVPFSRGSAVGDRQLRLVERLPAFAEPWNEYTLEEARREFPPPTHPICGVLQTPVEDVRGRGGLGVGGVGKDRGGHAGRWRRSARSRATRGCCGTTRWQNRAHRQTRCAGCARARRERSMKASTCGTWWGTPRFSVGPRAATALGVGAGAP